MRNPTPGRVMYEVKCSRGHSFPIDMLRYDCAYPATSEDSRLIAGSWWTRDPFTVTLRSHRAPTVDRWASFGCEVV